jgi:LysR family cyn operon transcriptional activator
LHHLRYFTALAEELSFTRAAEKVHITQSTLSHQIKQLEAELGQELFSRIGKRIVITEAGEMLLSGVIPRLVDQDPWAQLRRPMDMIRQG